MKNLRMAVSNLDKDKNELIKLINSSPNYGVLYKGLGKVVDKRRELSKYVWLPETDQHPELLIAQEVTEQGYNHQRTKEKLEEADSFMPTPELLAEFLRTCKSGKAYDGLKNRVDKKRLDKILEERLKVRDPWRGERLDHQYSLDKEGKLQVTYPKFVNGKLKVVTEILDPETLMEDRIPGISLEKWIENPTSQGLPKKDVKKGNLRYLNPRDGYVARFDACSDGVDLRCAGDPQGSYDGLGVRRAKIFHRK